MSAAALAGGLALTSAALRRLRARHASPLSRPARGAALPVGRYAVCAGAGAPPRLAYVTHAFGERYWIEPTGYLPGLWEHSPERREEMRRRQEESRLVTGAWLVDARRAEVPVVPLAEYLSEEGRERGQRLHKTLATFGVEDHHAFATRVAGRPVPHLRLLSAGEAEAVRLAARERAAESEGLLWEVLDRECREAGIPDPEAMVCRWLGLGERTPLDELARMQLLSALRRLREGVGRGDYGGRRPGESHPAYRERAAAEA